MQSCPFTVHNMLTYFYLLLKLFSIGLQLQNYMGSKICLWSATPSINHTNYLSTWNIYDNATTDTALIVSILHLFSWTDTQIMKMPVAFRCCSHLIHHHLVYAFDECSNYGVSFQLFLSLCHFSSATDLKWYFFSPC